MIRTISDVTRTRSSLRPVTAALRSWKRRPVDQVIRRLKLTRHKIDVAGESLPGKEIERRARLVNTAQMALKKVERLEDEARKAKELLKYHRRVLATGRAMRTAQEKFFKARKGNTDAATVRNLLSRAKELEREFDRLLGHEPSGMLF